MVRRKERAHPRRIFSTTVTYVNGLIETHEGARAVSLNISRSGVCLYTHHPHKKGALLTIKNGKPFNINGVAIVKWVKKINGNLYRIGCEFAELKSI